MDANNCIVIKKSSIVKTDNSCRMITPIIENGKQFEVYVEVESQYAQYLCTERADALVWLTLPVAIRQGYDIYCETSVTEMFLHNLNEVLIPQLALGDRRAYKTKIYAKTESSIIGGDAVGTGISCGVDSLFTVKKYSNSDYSNMNITHLFIANINMELLEPRNSNLQQWIMHNKPEFDRFDIVSKSIHAPIVKMYTNFFFYLCGKEFGRDWKMYHHLFVHNFITMASVLSIKKLWKIYYFSSTYDFTQFNIRNNITNDPAHYEVACMHALTVPDFYCFSAGAECDRLEKTESLFDYEIAQKTLHPCHHGGEKNCSNPTCDKCLRALIPLDYYNKLDLFSSVFDVDKYRKHRDEYFYNLVRLYNDKFSHVFYERIYELAKNKWPQTIQKAEERYQIETSTTVEKWEYNIVKKSYEIALELLKQKDPQSMIVSFFKKRGLTKIYLSGAPKFVSVLKQICSNECDLVFIDYKSGKPEECDGAFIGDAAQSIILNKRDVLINKGIQYDKIYSIFDLANELRQERDV